MRRLCALTLLACLWFGCSRTTSHTPVPGSPTSSGGNAPTSPQNTNRAGLIVTPGVVAGRVALVNSGSGFVVVGFPLGSVPPPDKRLNVYRHGLKVAELKVSRQQRESNTVADIVAGECQVGDEVREN